ncbi:hypothetical protein [Pseudogracilibacillus sp. SO30301A]|uniref:hypothetical protein n=1 Tax=Pseudogracilibacillus sp. SO30301A TaxID=3098291 RepID=UPI00300E02A8
MNNRFDTLEASLLNEKVNVMDQKSDGVYEQVAKKGENIELMQVDTKNLKIPKNGKKKQLIY